MVSSILGLPARILLVTLGLILLPLSPLAQDSGPAQELECPPCDDGNVCTADSCDTTTGTCRFDPVSCNDANPCTRDECVSDSSSPTGCVHVALPAGTLCDDGNPCTVESACSTGGFCAGWLLPKETACDDGNACTVEDACTDFGQCRGRALLVGTECDDGNLCTTGETCEDSPATGLRVCKGTLKECDDSNACTTDMCIPSTGECAIQPLDCDDGNVCTEDSCDPLTGCVRTFVEGFCDDGDPCTRSDFCQDGNCTHLSRCPLSSDCVRVACDPERGCLFEDLTGPSCEQGKCLSGGFCDEGACVFLQPNCFDGNECTDDICDAETGACSFPGIVCPDDGSPCTIETCDPDRGCVSVSDPVLPDADRDGVPDPCDNCPVDPNPDQNLCACKNFDVDGMRVERHQRGGGRMFWDTVDECDLRGFNVLEIRNNIIQVRLNTDLIPCNECVTGNPSSYSFVLEKMKSGKNLFVEIIHLDGRRELRGPALRSN
ncbi:MAG: hypothetical protein V3U86_05255 [Acidobacteriota bacterium]